MNLLIVESSGKVTKIQSILGGDWKVAASIGHVRDLPRDRTGVYPPDFEPRYEATERGLKVIADLKRLAAGADSVYLATDPDREGEAIAWHLKEVLDLKNPHRVTYTEITESAIKKAVAQPRPIDDNLVRAQVGRRVLDRLVGYRVSPAVTQIAGKNLSAGRVQTPALRLVVEREEAIRLFKSTTHYGVELNFGQTGTPEWKAVWNNKNWLPPGQEYFLDRDTADRLAALKTIKVTAYEEGESRQGPPPPFTTSTLQQAASNSLKLDPKETMEIAQKLYEAGRITYMRTDSPNIAKEAIDGIRALAGRKNWPLPEKPKFFKAKKGAQEAHEAIRPTDIEDEEAGDDENQRALYKLIWNRTVASQLAEAVYATVRGTLKAQLDGKEAIFEAKGRRLISGGWKTVLAEDQADESGKDKDKDELNNQVPKLTAGSDVNPSFGEVKTKKTSSPPRYTQAALIRELEKRGIGRPSTYAAIMDNITTRQYVQANRKRQLESTGLGDELIAYLKARFGFVDYDYTKNLEEKLDEIAEGTSDYLSVIRGANDILEKELTSFEESTGETCPACGKALRHMVRTGDAGFNFWGCSDRENCGATFQDSGGKPGRRNYKASDTEFACPDCGAPIKRIAQTGLNGDSFFACQDRDNCGARFKNDEGTPGEKLNKGQMSDETCPDCGQALRHLFREGPDGFNYWVCSDREKCGARFSDSNGKPGRKTGKIEYSQEACPDCGRQLSHIQKEGPGGYNFWACPDRENCGASFKDEAGRPGQRSYRPEPTDFTCPDCGNQLKRLVLTGKSDKSLFVCSNRDQCGARFMDEDGKPGPRHSQIQQSSLPCPECGQPLTHIRKDGPGGYNFWACPDRFNCGASFQDDNGQPGQKSGKSEVTDHPCPSCGQPLKHLQKDGPGGYNFWACSDRDNCGTTFRDDNGAPGQRNAKIELTGQNCPNCGQPLRHIRKDGPDGYNFWACSDRDNCGAKFRDNDGQPGEKNTSSPLSDHVCPDCGQRLRHLVKDGPDGYNFWACSSRECGTTFRDRDGSPGEKNAKKEKTPFSEFKCPTCQSPLYHRKGHSPKTDQDYDFFACSSRACNLTFRSSEDKPVFITAVTLPAASPVSAKGPPDDDSPPVPEEY
ncbi:MAG: type I DNA topoisomerase [Deltaproteobacteria bacterium]|jgi:DNA topoisomerase-1|nr:type I DNA topoisomerase [Deltaproteobacteria bacterium]